MFQRPSRAAEGQPARRTARAGAVQALWRTLGPREVSVRLPRLDHHRLERGLAASQRDLGAAMAARAEGMAMTVAQAMAEVAAYLDGEAGRTDGSPA